MMTEGIPMAPEGFVLDCSVTICWYFQDEVNDYAEAVQDEFAHVQAIVPAIWPLEVANALLMGERRKRSSEAQATAWTQHLATMPISVETLASAQAWGSVLAIARAYDTSAYDAAYLELAIRRGLPLATVDKKLKPAAARAGVKLYQPPKKRKTP
jgi:predicted nucleic acid-binding protein